MYIIIAIVLFFVVLSRFIQRLRFNQVRKLFRDGNCIVFGMRGSGKDLLFSNVVAYENKPYCSNMNYCDGNPKQPICFPFEPQLLRIGGNSFNNFTSDNIKSYTYPLPDNVHFFISDAGVYFPSQENGYLNRAYPEIPMFQALSRHLGDCNFHCNIQNVNRLWDKIREQSDTYIRCIKCKVSKRGVVKQTVIVYDKYQSAVDRVEPLKLRKPLLGKSVKNDIAITKAKYKAMYGNIIKLKLRYKNKGSYDSRRFKSILVEGSNVQENS